MPARVGAIPVIDLAPFLRDRRSRSARATAEHVRVACETVGFLVVTGHGIAAEHVGSMCAVTRAFFECPLADKLRWDFAEVGYRPSESGSLARTTGQSTPGDLCETFRYRPLAPGGEASPVFPSEPDGMSETWISWFVSMEKLAADVMSLFALALDLPIDWFVPYFERHSSTLIANYYPTPTTPPLDGQLRRGAHTDFGVVTILYQSADDGGLEVCHPASGEWLHVPFVPETFVINIGDLMERWTNGRWVSTMHRVVNPAPSGFAVSGDARISLPFFHRPDMDATISVIGTCRNREFPPRFEPVNAGEWMAAKQRLVYARRD